MHEIFFAGTEARRIYYYYFLLSAVYFSRQVCLPICDKLITSCPCDHVCRSKPIDLPEGYTSINLCRPPDAGERSVCVYMCFIKMHPTASSDPVMTSHSTLLALGILLVDQCVCTCACVFLPPRRGNSMSRQARAKLTPPTTSFAEGTSSCPWNG